MPAACRIRLALCLSQEKACEQMKWFSWFKPKPAATREPATRASLTQCPKCGKEMTRIEKTTMTGYDMRTYRCDDCHEEHILNFGPALWKVLSDANKSDHEASD